MVRALRLLVLMVALLLSGAARADEAPLPARVNRAVDEAAEFLVSKQAEDGSWRKDDKVHPLGRTALCTYALLHAGYERTDPPVAKALDVLGIGGDYAALIEPHSTYEAGCLLLMLHALGRDQDANVRHIADWLVENFNWSVGLWGYPTGSPDLSNSQYAALGLKVASMHGHEAPEKLWKRVVDSTLRAQHDCGAFRYRDGEMYRASMTHAALLILRFAREAMGGKPDKKIAAAMQRGHEWATDSLRVDEMPFGRGWTGNHYYYYMYGLERYAVIFGLKQIAGRDWYREGAEELLARRKKDWSWGNVENTSFAILFLRKVALTAPDRDRGGEASEEEAPVERKRPRPDGKVEPIREWLVAGPFLEKKHEDDGLFNEHFRVERVRPGKGTKAGKKRWELRRTAERKLSLGNTAWCVNYAAVWVHADAEGDALLWYGSDDGSRAYWNGDLVNDGHHHDGGHEDRYRVPIKLVKGANLLIVKVENLGYGTWVCARISDPDGKLIPSLRYFAGR